MVGTVGVDVTMSAGRAADAAELNDEATDAAE